MKETKTKPVFKSKQVWLITWEWEGDNASVENKVVAVINYRRTPEQISFFLEQLLIYRNSTVGEMASYAKNRELIPYKARRNGIDADSLLCGHNPRLYARRAYDFKVYSHNPTTQELHWFEKRILPNRGDTLFKVDEVKMCFSQVKSALAHF